MTINRALRPLALAAVIAVALSGCILPGGASSTPSMSATASASPSPVASPSPSTSPTPTPALADDGCPDSVFDGDDPLQPVIDYNRFQTVCIGMTFAEADAAWPNGITQPGECPWNANIITDDTNYVYLTAFDFTDFESAPYNVDLFRLAYYGDPSAPLPYPLPRTLEGIGIGSTDVEVFAAYPGATSATLPDESRGGDRDFIVSTNADGLSYSFNIESGYVSEMAWGKRLAGGGIIGHVCAL